MKPIMIVRKYVFAICSIVFSCHLNATEYMGFNLGVNGSDQVEKILKSTESRYATDFGYKGYTELKMYKVDYYERFNKFGKVNQAWLNFDPADKLYEISVEYSDAGNIFKIFKDALDSKYGNPSSKIFGFNQSFSYRDGDVNIILHRNSFGFGEDQKTSLTYTFSPSLGKVEQMKVEIENNIRHKNAAKAASDL